MNIKDQTLAKLFTVIGFLESNALLKETKTKSEFTSYALSVIGETPLKKSITNFFDHLHDHHAKSDNPDHVWVAEKGDAFMAILKEATPLMKNGMGKDEIKRILFPHTPISPNPPQSIPKPKHGWLNLIRKIIDLIDDEF